MYTTKKPLQQEHKSPAKLQGGHRFFQPQLKRRDPGNSHENEADHMAAQVMRKPATPGAFFNPPAIQRQQPVNPDEPEVRAGEPGDVVEAVTQVPFVSNFLTRLGDDFLLHLENTWDASLINKFGLIGGGLSLSAGLGLAVYAARNNPGAIDLMVSPLSGAVIAPFDADLFPAELRAFAFEVNFDRYDETSSVRNYMGGIHFDVGRFLPDAWNFGPVTTWAPLGAPWETSTPVQRKCAHCEEEEQLQRKEENANSTGSASELENYVGGLSSSGSPLPEPSKQFFGSRMGYDFSNVQVHTDSVAVQSAQSINALAYTSGSNIVFNQNQYQPETDTGKKLLAHELTHVVQQAAGAGNTVSRYSHDSVCKQEDLESIVWPGNTAAGQIINNAIRVLGASPNDPLLTPLYKKYFMTSSPRTSRILKVFMNLKEAFDESDYQFECVYEDCDDYRAEVSTVPLVGGIGDIRLCIKKLSGNSHSIIGRTMVHEFTHYFERTDDNAYCKGSGGCPDSLTPEQALDNADSFACFAYDLLSVKI